MIHRWFISLLFFSVLSGCTKPPDLDAPCREFGKYCPQYPINEGVIE